MAENKSTVIGTFEGECADANITNLNGLDITRPVWENVFASEEYAKAIELPNEQWCDVPEFEAMYEVSNYGRIRSKDRVRKQLNRYGKYINHPYKGKLIKLDYSTSRFGVAHLYDVDRKVEWPIYALVCNVFGQTYADLFFYGTEHVDTLDGEVWAPVSGYPDYFVSNQGRVAKHTPHYKILLKPWTAGQYLTVNLSCDKLAQSYPIHRLVATAFVANPDPILKIQVNHIDGNKLNNCASNLEWVTQSENAQHAYRIGLCVPDLERLRRAQKLGTAKVRVKIEVPELGTTFESISQCAAELDVPYDSVCYYSSLGKSYRGHTFIRR